MLSRQAAKLAKKDLLSISPNLGAFASLRETQFFLIFSLSQNFKYLWLDFSLEQRLCESTATAAGKPAFPVKSNFMAFALFGFHIEVTPLLRTPSTDG
jgi:hypothetical protein